MHDSIFAASDETLRTVQVLYFGSRTWIIERSSQQCVLHSLSADLSAQRERNAWRVSVMSDHELLLECWRAAWWQNPSSWRRPRPLWFVFAVAYRVATWLLLPPISLGYTECIHSRSVIEFHTCHTVSLTVFSARCLCTLKNVFLICSTVIGRWHSSAALHGYKC